MATCKHCGKPLILSSGKCIYCGKAPVEPTPEGCNIISGQGLSPIRTFNINNVAFNMILVEGGTFMMGCTDDNIRKCNLHTEKPAHRKTVSSFYIGECQVTQLLWKSIMIDNPSFFKGDNRPVEMVSWNDCIDFIDKINRLTNNSFRLPTEAEWEFAGRGGNKSKGYKYCGSNCIDDVAWYWKNSGNTYLNVSEEDFDGDIMEGNKCQTHPVKTKYPNELGVYDMSGNVLEWCEDVWRYYDETYNVISPPKPNYRVLRGGFYGSLTSGCRVSYRDVYEMQFRTNFTGFRLAMTSTFEGNNQ